MTSGVICIYSLDGVGDEPRENASQRRVLEHEDAENIKENHLTTVGIAMQGSG